MILRFIIWINKELISQHYQSIETVTRISHKQASFWNTQGIQLLDVYLFVFLWIACLILFPEPNYPYNQQMKSEYQDFSIKFGKIDQTLDTEANKFFRIYKTIL